MIDNYVVQCEGLCKAAVMATRLWIQRLSNAIRPTPKPSQITLQDSTHTACAPKPFPTTPWPPLAPAPMRRPTRLWTCRRGYALA